MEENQTKSPKSTNKAIVIVLAILLLAALAYVFYSTSKHNKLTDAIEDEKLEIEENLDSMIVKYEDAIADNTSMSNELSFERDRIIALRDSLKNLKSTNYNLIRRYRRQLASLERTNERLFRLNDSLSSRNEELNVYLDSANVKLSTQLANIDTLTQQNLTLAEKVAIGGVLKVNKANVVAMRERNNGKLVQTSRSRNTDAFRINFTIEENEISEPGERDVFIQITDSKGNVISSKGSITIDETMYDYSDRTLINYLNEDVDVVSLVEVDREKINKGTYNINVIVDGKIIGDTYIKLK